MLKIDYFLLELIVAELRAKLSGASLAKVHQPGDDSLVLRLWNGRQTLKLLLQVGSESRLHLTRQEFNNPFQPPRFCQLLRSRLKRLETIRLLGYERVVELCFDGVDQRYRLVCELIGNRGNLYLFDAADLLIDALHKPQMVGDRLLRRGEPYIPLTQTVRLNLADPNLVPPENLYDAPQLEQWLMQEVSPMSKGQAAVLGAAVHQKSDILKVFSQFKEDWLRQRGQVSLIESESQPRLVAYSGVGARVLKSATDGLSQFLDQCFSPSEEVVSEIGERARFRHIVKTQISRLQKRQKNIVVEQQKSESFTERRHQGELLLANLPLVKKGMRSVEVTDWGVDPPQAVTIELQAELNPQENAARLFKRYKKEKRGVDHVERRQQETAEELEWLESLLLALDEAQEASDVIEVGLELLAAGLISVKKSEPVSRRKVSAEPRLNQTLSPGGLRIFWGRNNRSNDHLSAHMTAADDLWFHAYQMPGCHLVLKRDGIKGDFSAADIEYAARIAAGFSRGKDEPRVDVIVTEGRHVKRPKGAKPGLVTLTEHRTLRVFPLRVRTDENPLDN
ncbi:Rqc2 family fibronectin-binding protein [Geopsychrobacter electrodiphilus]|uniref:Rqc2 family fibronectin-binding protein n=1 Tax=Geopsychrobacter electrodiphilus TaxID=225196 RepID=UPI00037D7882|nr:NFACT family protein [Geopsychrobacter electrodiphilus]